MGVKWVGCYVPRKIEDYVDIGLAGESDRKMHKYVLNSEIYI